MKRKKRVSKKKVTRFCMLLLIVFLLLFVIFNVLIKNSSSRKQKKEVKIEEKIDGYGYELADNESAYYKSLFKNLKTVLSEDEVDEEKYASLVCQLFLADFFHLENKLSKNDVGGIQFVYEEFQSDFENLAKESVYHYVESNIYGDRLQKLPVVTEVSVINIKQESFQYLNQVDEHAYQIDLKVIYEEDLGYQEDVTLVLAHHNKKLEIIKMSE